MNGGAAEGFRRRYPIPDDFGDVHAEYQALVTTGGWLDAPWESLLVVEGEDAAEFLHSLLTQEILALPDGRTTPAALADRKGHWRSDLWVHRDGDRFLLRLRGDRLAVVTESFERHRFSERVRWSVEPSIRPFLLLGPAARDLFRRLGGSEGESEREGGRLPPPFAGFWMQVRETDPHDRVVFPSAGDLEHPLDRLSRPANPVRRVGARAFHLRRIEAGTPWFGLDGDEERLVPEVVPEDRVSLRKGCFLGQETIARLAWRGRLRRRLARVELEGAEPPEPGTPLLTDAGERCGVVLSAAVRPNGGIPAFALRELRADMDADRSRASTAPDRVSTETGGRGSWLPETDRTGAHPAEPA